MKFAEKLQKQKNAIPEVMKIIRMGDPHYSKILKESQNVQLTTQRLKRIIESLKLTAQNENAISLSCPQIGYHYRIFVMLKKFETNKWSYENIKLSDYETYINPFKIKQSLLNQVEWEECPSYPFLMGKMERSQKILIKYQNENDQLIQRWAEDFEARVLQHELEHLQGLTIERPDSMLLESKRQSFQSDEYDISFMEQQQHGMEVMMKNMKIQQQVRKK